MSELYWQTEARMARLAPSCRSLAVSPVWKGKRVPGGIVFINPGDLRWRDALRE